MPIEIINLDEMIPEEKTVRYKQKDHALHITTTEAYLKVLKARKKLGKIADDDEVGQTELAIELLVLALPTIPKDDLMRLPLNAMMKLVQVVQQEMDMSETAAAIAAEEESRAEGAIEVGANGRADERLGELTLASSSPA